MTIPTVSKHWRKPVGLSDKAWIPSGPLTTPPCYNNTTLGNCLYAWRKGPNVTNPICWTCKNSSYKCAADCEHCVTQSSTEQLWQYPPLTSRHLKTCRHLRNKSHNIIIIIIVIAVDATVLLLVSVFINWPVFCGHCGQHSLDKF